MTDYTKYDFNQILERLSDLVQEEEGFGQAYKSSNTQTFLEAVADITDHLHYMLERRSRENFLPTAKLDSSVLANVNLIGYRPRRIVSAKGTLELTILDSDGNETSPEGIIKIPRFTKVFFGDRKFITLEEIEITPNDSGATFEVAEGTLQSLTFDPQEDNLLSNYGFILIEDYQQMDNDIIEVNSETEKYLDVRKTSDNGIYYESLSFASSDDAAYDIRIAHDGLRVVFGNNYFGKFPDSSITIEYLETSGPEIRIINTGLSFEFEDSILTDDYNVFPPNEYSYSLKNITEIGNGLEAEKPIDIKKFAPEFVRSGNRAVTNNDFRYWAIQSGIAGIVDAYSYGEEEIGITVFNMNNIYLTYLKEDGSALTNYEKKDLKDYFDNLKIITTQLVFKQAELIPISFDIRVGRGKRLEMANSELFDIIKNEIKDWFEFKDGSIGGTFYLSELIEHFQSFTVVRDGIEKDLVSWITIDAYPVYDFTYSSSKPLDESIPVPLIKNEDEQEQILPGSLVVMSSEGQEIGYDDPDGSIKASEEGEGDLILDGFSSTIYGVVDYRNGSVTTDEDLPEGSYYIKYLYNEDRNIETNYRSAITYKDFPETIGESPDNYLSSITIVDN